jgi:hypothetical protein
MDKRKMFDEGDVRRAIQQSAYTVSLTELERKGRSQVKVIKGRRIYELIAQAVNQVVETSTGSLAETERKAIIESSRREFDRLLKTHHDEAKSHREAETELVRSQARVELLQQDKTRLESRVRELEEELGKSRGEGGSNQILAQLAADMTVLRGNLEGLRAGVAQDQGAGVSSVEGRLLSMLDDTMDKLSARFDRKLDSIEEEKAYKAIEAAEVVLDGLFAAPNALESNLGDVGTRQAEEGDIADQLSRLRNMRGKTADTADDGQA